MILLLRLMCYDYDVICYYSYYGDIMIVLLLWFCHGIFYYGIVIMITLWFVLYILLFLV